MSYSKYFQSVLLDQHSIPQHLLNIEQKRRTNPLKWNGQFSPQLVEVLLDYYAEKGFTIFDPFSGSGTVLLEAGSAGYAALGTEVNPAAYCLCKTYSFINMLPGERKHILCSTLDRLSKGFELKSLKCLDSNLIEAELVKQNLAQVLEQVTNEAEMLLLQSLITLLDFHKKGLNEQKVFRTWNKLQQHIINLPYSEQSIDIFLADARSTPVTSGSVNLVITSPPYINVFNYHQQYRASLEYLDYDLLSVARSEIGSNRKHRGNRFLTVIQYCLDIVLTFAELSRICCAGSRIIFIVGRESTVKGVRFFNGEIVADVVYNVFGMPLIQRQERCFRNRFGQYIYEDILHFISHKIDIDTEEIITKSRDYAFNILLSTLNNGYTSSNDDIIAALSKIKTVAPSPLLQPECILKDNLHV